MPQLGQGVAPEIFAFHHPEHPISRQYAGLLAKMQEGLTDARAKVVLLTGCRSHVGTSTVLLNLAVTATQKNMGRVVVVDAHVCAAPAWLHVWVMLPRREWKKYSRAGSLWNKPSCRPP